jgi:hypothetical protein
MKNRNELQVRLPNPAELYALEHQARRLRAAEIGRLINLAALAVRNFFNTRGLPNVRSSTRTNGVRHA